MNREICRRARALFRNAVLVACAAIAAPAMASPTIDVDFIPSSIVPGGSTQLYFFITNPDGVSMSGGTLTTLTYPAGLVNTATPVWTNTCSGTSISASPGGNTVSWTNLSLGPTPASCSIGILVTSATEGTYSVTVPSGGFIASTGGNFSAATTSPNLTVAMPTLTVTSTADSGAGTLRQAITDANATCGSGPWKIAFGISGAGPHLISVGSSLPAITCSGTVIDGYTQSGAAANTDTGGTSNANIQIILNGSGCAGCDGLVVTGSGLTIRGLAVHSFSGTDKAGIRLAGGTANIYGNYLGTDPGGNAALGNGYGIVVDSGFAAIGGTGDAAKRNLVTGNLQGGIWVGAGTSCLALAAPWEPTHGLKAAKVAGASADIYNNQIGGTRGGLNTVFNTGPGIYFSNGGTSCPVRAIEGNLVRFNTEAGIFVANGGDLSVASNSIYSNGGAGVVVASGDYIAITSNSIHSNGGPGIDLGNDGVTANDYANPPTTLEHDTDSGANRLVNHPDILSVIHSGGDTLIDYDMKGPPFSSVRVEFFSNSSAPAMPSGEQSLGVDLIFLDSIGNYSGQHVVSGSLQDNISATATHDSCGECGFDLTSEFSPAVAVVLPPTVTTTFSPASTKVGVGSTFYVVVSNPNSGAEITGASYSVTLPNGIAVTQALASGCGTQYSAGFTSTTATLSNATVAAGGSCMYSITVFPNAAGAYTYNAGALTIGSDQGSASNASGTTLTVTLQPPVVTVFLPPSAAFGSPVPMTVGVARTASDPAYGSISASMALPSVPGVVTVANPSNYVRGCGATGGSATAGGTSVSASGGSWASNGSCALISVSLAFPAPGTYTVSIDPGNFTYTLQGSSNTWSNTSAITATITITSPVFSVGTPSLSFGNQEVGTQSAPQAATITNAGSASLVLSSITGPAGFPFTGCSPLPLTLPAGGSCTLSVKFAPSATGPQSGNIQIASNASGSPHSVGVSGTGTVSDVSLSSTAVSFGSQTVNTSSGTQSVTVTNSGTASLSISAISVAGDFGFTGCASPLTLSPGASCTLSIYFFPTTTGNLAGSVSIASNASGSPHVIGLSGTGTPLPVPGIALAPSSAAFGTILAGTSANQVLALSNPGTANLDISSISVIDLSPAAMRAKAVSFSQTNDCPTSLAPSAACNITVTYAPAVAGSHAGELHVVSNAVPSPLVAALSGSANSGTTPGLQLSASSVTFAPQFPNTTSAAQSVTLTSSGTAPLVISQVAASGDFGFSGCGPSTLAPGATCSFAVTFKPLSEGPHSGAIVITSNAPGSPHTLSLSGTGSPRLAPEISLSPADFAFGPVRTQRSVTLRSRLTNAGAAPLEISQISSSGSFFAQANDCPSSIAVGAFCDITVTYAPTATGPHSGQLVILSNALPSPYIAALSGSGINVPPPFLDVDGALDFGQQVAGVTVRRTLTLANTGGDPLVISQMALIGSGAFGLEGACATIAPETSCDLTVTFTPSALTGFTARLDIVSNHSGGVVQVSLSGIGTALPQPALELSVGALGFGSQGVGSITSQQSVRLTSVGAVAAQINAIAASLPDFIVNASQCPSVLAPQQACDIGVAFKPVASGARIGSLVVQSNAVPAGGLPHSASLIGVGCRFFTMGASRNPQRLCAP